MKTTSDPLTQTTGAFASAPLIRCAASESLSAAARLMSERGIHSLVVVGSDSADDGFRLLTDTDLLAALEGVDDPDDVEIGPYAASGAATVDASTNLAEAASVMREHQVSHLFVLEEGSDEPASVISSLDIARAMIRGGHAGPQTMDIVVAHDASPSGDDAVALADLIAPQGAQVTATMVVPFPPGELGDPPVALPERAERWDELCAGLRQAGERALAERAVPKLERLSPETQVLLGDSPQASLSVLCETTNPDLLVVGSTHRGNIGRVLLGSTGQHLAHGLNTPLAVAPKGFAGHRPDRIATVAVAFDAGAESWRALELAARLARLHEARLLLVSVTSPHLGQFGTPSGVFDDLSVMVPYDYDERELRAKAEEAAALYDDLETEVKMLSGDVGRTLVTASHRSTDLFDLLVVGSRRYGPVGRLLMGSVAARVAAESEVPVVIAERP